MEEKIPSRAEADPAYTWALTDLFADDAMWEKACRDLGAQLEKAKEYDGTLGESAAALYGCCALMTDINVKLGDVYGYANRRYDEDTANSASQAMLAEASSLLADCSSALSFADPQILAIPDETLERFFDDEPALKAYRRSLGEIRRFKDHVLTPAEENLLAAAGRLARSPEAIFSMMNNADAVYPPVIADDGSELALTNGSLVPLLQSSDRRIRRDAFMNFYHTLAKNRNTYGAVLAAQVDQLRFFADARRYPSALEASLFGSGVPAAVYTNLICAVHENMDKMYRYMDLRKRLLGLDKLHMYDLYTPIVQDTQMKITFEEAEQMVLAALAPLGDDYLAILREGFEGRWIDVYENTGKRSGAYSAGHSVHPYVLLNYKDDLNSVFTLAHEMGHAAHSYLSHKYQAPQDSQYVIFVAEVASTCNEALLMQYLLGQTTDKRERAYLINYFLEQFRTTLYRQTMFAEFELKINEAAAAGTGLTAAYFCELYHGLNELYYGPDVAIDPEIDLEWARIPHFYYDFYVYQYSTGFSAAIALSRRILTGGPDAVEDYVGFLKGGCSKDPISLLKDAGVDMSTPAPVDEALDLFGELLDEMEELI